MVHTRTIDPYLVVPSRSRASDGTQRRAGDFVQPGNVPAPYSVATSPNLDECERDRERHAARAQGSAIHVSVMAFPGRVFDGEISMVGATVDPQLHRGLVRARSRTRSTNCCPGCSHRSSSSPARRSVQRQLRGWRRSRGNAHDRLARTDGITSRKEPSRSDCRMRATTDPRGSRIGDAHLTKGRFISMSGSGESDLVCSLRFVRER